MCLILALTPAHFFAGKANERKEVSVESIYLDPANEKKAENIIFAEKLESLLEKNDMNGALLLFDSLPPELAADPELKLLKAAILVSANRIDEASKITAELLKIDGKNKDVLELNAQVALSSGNKQMVQTALKQLLASDPTNAAANIMLADQQALNKKYKQAAGYYKKALVKEPKNMDALLGFGRMSYYQNNMKEAKLTFERMLKIEPNNSDALASMGKVYAEEENYFRAASYVKDALKIDSSSYDLHIDLGNYERYQGHYKEAEDAWTAAISIEPKYFLAYAYRAGLRDEQNRFQDALADYRKVIETNPKYYFAYEAIGILEFHLEHWQAARDAFHKANALSNSAAYQLMSIATYLKENNLQEAKKYAQTAMRPLARESLEYKMMRLYHDQGPISAENAIARDIEKEKNKTQHGKMMYYLALYYELKNLPQAASEYYAKIQKMKAPLFFEYRLAEWGIKS